MRENNGKNIAVIDFVGLGGVPPAPVMAQVGRSALNHRDALTVCGDCNGIINSLPRMPGIDLAGTVAASSGSSLFPGDEVLMAGALGSICGPLVPFARPDHSVLGSRDRLKPRPYLETFDDKRVSPCTEFDRAPLEKKTWANATDIAGSETLAQTRSNSTVATCDRSGSTTATVIWKARRFRRKSRGDRTNDHQIYTT